MVEINTIGGSDPDIAMGGSDNHATAGKVLFPIPNRRLSKRLYRLCAPTLLAWGAQDRFIAPEHFAPAWKSLVPHATVVEIPEAGHLVTLERPDQLAVQVAAFLDNRSPPR